MLKLYPICFASCVVAYRFVYIDGLNLPWAVKHNVNRFTKPTVVELNTFCMVITRFRCLLTNVNLQLANVLITSHVPCRLLKCEILVLVVCLKSSWSTDWQPFILFCLTIFQQYGIYFRYIRYIYFPISMWHCGSNKVNWYYSELLNYNS